MRIVLDECVPRALRRQLPGHNVLTAPELGWAGKKNGELMQLVAANGFDVFLTVDKNIRFQQDLKSLSFGVILLSAVTNRLADLLALMPQVVAALPTIKPGTLVEIKV